MLNDLEDKKIFAKNLKYYMNLYNKDRNKLCNDLNIPPTTLSDWLNAKKYPRIEKIKLLANYFNIQKADLIEDTEKLSKEVKTYEYLSKIDDESLKLIQNDIDFIEKYKILFDKDEALSEDQKNFMINFIIDQHNKMDNKR